jgi:selenium metabolism protein YedF
LIATRKALRENKDGTPVRVLTDNVTSMNNIARFLKDNSISFSLEEENGVYAMTISDSGRELENPDAEAYCSVEIPHFNKGTFVVAISSDTMGEGDPVLGKLLMENFIKALHDLDVLPSKIVFYNRGVLLGVRESAVADVLAELETMGVGLFICATCVNHYGINDRIKTGTLSNMFEIAQIMASASNVVKP